MGSSEGMTGQRSVFGDRALQSLQTGFFNWLLGDPRKAIAAPPPNPPGYTPTNPEPGPTPHSLHDFATMHRRPLSPNVLDARGRQPSDAWRLLQDMFNLPVPQQGPAQRPLINWNRLDPKTWELSNAPEAEAAPPPSSASGALLPGNQQDAIALAQEQGQRQAQQAKLAGDTGNQAVGGMPADFTDPKVRRQVKRNYRELNRLLASSEPDSGIGESLLENLLRQGAITITPDSFSTALPFPGGREAHQRMVEFVDRYRAAPHPDYSAAPPYAPDQLRRVEGILGILPPSRSVTIGPRR